ncbi:MAG: tyrosine-protein phosphatase [Xanthomonadales bacterium]|nr:tyrosine-protein phosphatase [Xanthomonadales bacterium]
MDRVLPLTTVHNFRDLGGYRTRDGASVRWRRLFRSGQLSDLDGEDQDAVAELGIREVHDFRRPEECERFPSRLPGSVTTRTYPLGIASLKAVTDLVFSGQASAAGTRQMMVDGYRGFVRDLSPELSTFLKAMAQPSDHGILMHCLAGKDRTGAAVALLLSALDVPRDTIVEDYLLSAEHFPVDSIMDLLLGYFARKQAPPVSREALQPYCGVDADYLLAAFDEIDARHGGTDAYLSRTLGLSESQRQTLRDNFLR